MNSFDIVKWSVFKDFVTSRDLIIQYIEDSNFYYLKAADEWFQLQCNLDKANDSSEVDDFEDNFKTDSNTVLSIRDNDNALMVRSKIAPIGWTYHAHFFEIESSKAASLHDKKVDGTDWSWCTLKFYNSANEELTEQSILDTDCVKTVVDCEPLVDFELIGGDIRALSSPNSNIRLYVIGAPDISSENGGSKYMISGVNLKFIGDKQALHTDGRVSKRIPYNAEDHRGKLRFIFKHDAGVKVQVGILIEGYKV